MDERNYTASRGTDRVAGLGGATHLSYHLALLAEALGWQGQIAEGLGMLATGLAHMDGQGESFHGAELHRLRGELLLRQQTSDETHREAEACFHRALAISRRQQAKSLELRAMMSLTRLFQKRDRQPASRQMLGECYDWFTEGFDTRDLQEAKVLLEQIL